MYFNQKYIHFVAKLGEPFVITVMSNTQNKKN